jgi:uncharacterized membrane protein
MSGTESQKQEAEGTGWLERLHPLHRLLLSFLFSGIAFLVIPAHSLSPLLLTMLLWIVFAIVFNATGWIILFTRPIHRIKKVARQDDGSKVFVFVMVLISSFSGLFAVLLLMISGDNSIVKHPLFLPAAVGGMLQSWIMVHTIFTFHYAHMYYDDENAAATARGLLFPGDEAPDYLDFAYFSFVIGSTFQVSDVQVTSQGIRRLVFMHSLLSFALNTFVVALSINLVAGLK